MPPTPNFTDSILARPEQTLFLLGGYTDKSVLAHAPAGGEGDGFYSVIFDPESAQFTGLRSSSVETNPAFIMKHPTLDIVYMTTEVISDEGSELLVGRLDRKSGRLTVLDRKKIHGRSSCHISWDYSGSHLIVVSYWDSKLTTFPVDDAGMLGEVVHVYSQAGAEYVDTHRPDRWEHLSHRQRWPHLHQVNREPARRMFLVPDLGQDQIQCFKVEQGEICHLGSQQLRRGAGPRHLEFNKLHHILYVCGELDNTVTVLRYNTDLVSQVMAGNFLGDVNSEDQSGSLLSQLQTVKTVPDSLTTKSTIAEMRLHPSGRFLYVGNRGHNSIAVFRVDQSTGTLSLVDIQDSHGAFPRHFNFDRTSQFLVVGNHASDNIVAFKILETGGLEMVSVLENVPSIVWLTPVSCEERD